MEVTKSNFASSLPNIKEAINECDFIAVDTELTGLSTEVTEHAFDTIAERYSKLRENCMQFIIIQFGLSTFKYHPKKNRYTHKDFNFYIFPRPHIRQAPDPKFMCQTSSLHFLASQNFDFNKVIYDGIPYLSPAQETKIRVVLDKRHKTEKEALLKVDSSKANGQKVIEVPKEQEQFVADIHERIEAFIQNEAETELELEPCSSYQRKLIYETVQQKFETGLDMQSGLNKDNKRVITIVKATDEEKYAKLNMKQINDFDDLEAAIGFRKIIDLISESKKLVIGHNMLLDLMHTLHQFYSPLPEKLDDFKEMLHMTFPQIMDTKLLASSEKLREFFESTQLTEIAKTVQGKAFNLPPIEPADGFRGYNLQSDKAHEAGFDAFLTGFSYLGMIHKLASIGNAQERYSIPDSKLLSPYCNRLYIMKQYDIGALNICAPDPEPDRDNVFYVSFPEEWKTIDLVELFLPYGNIYVNWLDDVSALVALKNRENIINAKSNLLNKPSRLYTVRSYAEYHRAMNKQSVIKKTTDVKRTQTYAMNSESSGNKRRASGSAESMELIPEGDENEAEKADNPEEPSAKRQKRYREENDSEVTSTAKVFEEENTW